MTATWTTDPHVTEEVIALVQSQSGPGNGTLADVPTRLVSPVLVGRREELAALSAAFERATTAEPVIVVVGGEAGVGKTRLVDEAAARTVEQGARVLTGRCVELGGE